MLVTTWVKPIVNWIKRYLEDGASVMIGGIGFVLLFVLCIVSSSKLSEFATLLAGLGQFVVAFLLLRLTTRQFKLSEQIANRESRIDERQYRLEMYDRRRELYRSHHDELNAILLSTFDRSDVVKFNDSFSLDINNLFDSQTAELFRAQQSALLALADARRVKRQPLPRLREFMDEDLKERILTANEARSAKLSEATDNLMVVQHELQSRMRLIMSLEYR